MFLLQNNGCDPRRLCLENFTVKNSGELFQRSMNFSCQLILNFILWIFSNFLQIFRCLVRMKSIISFA